MTTAGHWCESTNHSKSRLVWKNSVQTVSNSLDKNIDRWFVGSYIPGFRTGVAVLGSLTITTAIIAVCIARHQWLSLSLLFYHKISMVSQRSNIMLTFSQHANQSVFVKQYLSISKYWLAVTTLARHDTRHSHHATCCLSLPLVNTVFEVDPSNLWMLIKHL